jgi:hypothetical protein
MDDKNEGETLREKALVYRQPEVVCHQIMVLGVIVAGLWPGRVWTTT